LRASGKLVSASTAAVVAVRLHMKPEKQYTQSKRCTGTFCKLHVQHVVVAAIVRTDIRQLAGGGGG
jgi:hypothetical protein